MERNDDLAALMGAIMLLVLLVVLSGCAVTTTNPDGSVTEKKEPPRLIAGEPGRFGWFFKVDTPLGQFGVETGGARTKE